MPRKRKLTRDLEAGLKEIVDHLQGKGPKLRTHIVMVPDVRSVRRNLGLTQHQFSSRFGLNLRTVQDWEQRRVMPDLPARVLLKVIAASPKTVERAVAKG
jgi:putative transcriptional regulator